VTSTLLRDRATAGTAAAPVRPRSRGRFVLGIFAICASAGIALVSVTDPYAGARASAFYKEPVLASDSGVQRYEIDGGYVLVDIERDTYKVVEAEVPDAPVGDAGAGVPGYTTPVGVAQTYAAKAVAARGWAPSEFSCLVNLWNRESGWNTHAANPSGAYGIPQALPGSKMASAGPDWQNSYQTQIAWGLGYVAGRYGSPCGAWAHSNAAGWY
jgi:hypothetical protein